MAKDQSFVNGDQTFDIYLDDNGDLHFKANGKNGDGDTRGNTLYIGGAGDQSTILVGGGAGQYGRVTLYDRESDVTIDLDAGDREVQARKAHACGQQRRRGPGSPPRRSDPPAPCSRRTGGWRAPPAGTSRWARR
jgi:hypothetical protein